MEEKKEGREFAQMCCSFTGHRAIKAEHSAHISSFVARAIGFAYEKGCRIFCAGGALGFDTVAAKEIIRFRISHRDIKLILMLPSQDQDKLWSDRDKDLYYYILSEADEIFYSSDEYKDGCMRRRNQRLAESCDILIGYVGNRRSGSGQTLGMAERLGKEIYNLYPAIEKEVRASRA